MTDPRQVPSLVSHGRRDFVTRLARATGAVALLPTAIACGGASTEATGSEPEHTAGGDDTTDALALPMSKPADWNALSFNLERGNAGAVPESYREAINGPEGETRAIGKHLPYRPEVGDGIEPAGYVALMIGDAARGFPQHPAAAPTEANPTGHWIDWIRIRKATDDDASEMQSNFSSWPALGEGDNGRFVPFAGDDITAESGKNTVYLSALPPDVAPGDLIRVVAHCSTHGEYVEFIEIPA